MNQTAQIAILMATYNGERYLPKQLDSILNQDFEDWVLLVSDDGSKDRTMEILSDYQKRYPQKIKLLEKEKPSGGAKKNFLFLTRQADGYPYLMYCDQDDFWKPEKIRVTLEKMRETENGDPATPCLVHTDLEVVDQTMNTISPSFFRFSGLRPERCGLNQLLIQNIVTGCTMMINHALWELAVRPVDEEQILMHDWWFALIAAAVGRIGFVNQSLILYRQHGDNSVGAKNMHSAETIALQMTKHESNRNALRHSMLQAGTLLTVLDGCLKERDREMLRVYSQAEKTGKLSKIRVSARYGIWKNSLIKKAAQLFYY